MSISHADQHDLDKLARWRQDLSNGDSDQFPVYCVFLVSPDDLASHDVFRRFRSSFEDRSAGFQHLMIFGQHGISATLQALLAEFGLTLDQVPALVLFTAPEVSTAYATALTQGAEPGKMAGHEPWQKVLNLVEAVADRGDKTVEMASVAEVNSHPLVGGSLPDVVARVHAKLS
jgi:hypothetical protein